MSSTEVEGLFLLAFWAPPLTVAAGRGVVVRRANFLRRTHQDAYVYSPKRGGTVATRTYASGNRTFEITLSGSPAGIPARTPTGSYSSWTVEHVYDKSINEERHVPGMDSIVASTEDDAFARTCDLIDKPWRSKT